jgi:hypothetical protein
MVALCLGKGKSHPCVFGQFHYCHLSTSHPLNYSSGAWSLSIGPRECHTTGLCALVSRDLPHSCVAHANRSISILTKVWKTGFKIALLGCIMLFCHPAVVYYQKTSIRFWPSKYCRGYNSTNPVNSGHIISQWIIAGYILRIHRSIRNIVQIYSHTF